jgi:hypothetical protein
VLYGEAADQRVVSPDSNPSTKRAMRVSRVAELLAMIGSDSEAETAAVLLSVPQTG